MSSAFLRYALGSRFLEYTHTLNWYVPAAMIPPLGVVATGAETLFGLLLLVGWQTRATALLSGGP